MIHEPTNGMNQRVLLPSRRLVFLTTAAFAVTIGALFAATSCDLRPNVDLSSLKTDQKHDSCLLELSDGRWELMTDGCPEPENGVLYSCDDVHTEYPRQWIWNRMDSAASCIPRQLEHKQVLKTFQNRRIALVGDSHLRKLSAYMHAFLEDENISKAPTSDKKEHKDFLWKPKYSNISIEFYWRANVITATNLIDEWLEKKQAPDMLVLDPSAHQAKWARNFTEFKGEIPGLVESLTKYRQEFGEKKPVFWIISPPFKEPFTRDDENVTWMYSLKKFNWVLVDAGFMAPRGPVYPIDLYSMAQGCMDWCYRDGTHVVEHFNTLLWQILTGAYRHIQITK